MVSLAPRGNLIETGDPSKINPSMVGGGRGPRERLIGTPVMVIKGPSKGVAGVIKDTNGNLARVGLLTGNKVISIDKSKLKRRKYVTYSYSCLKIHCVATRADGTLEKLNRESADEATTASGQPPCQPENGCLGDTTMPSIENLKIVDEHTEVAASLVMNV